MKKLIIALFLIILFSGCVDQNKPIACTEEAKICPDGSAVGRVPPDCEFAPCPSETNCSLFSVDKCPTQCVICPPCEVCSSISCQTEEFCKSMGFNRSWWESVRPKNCQCPEGYIADGNVCNPKCYYSVPKCLIPSIPCNPGTTTTTTMTTHETIIPPTTIENKLFCQNKLDCVPAACCHPNSCINKNFKPDCGNIGCTANCEPGTMDCGQGYCDCINSGCKMVLK